MAVGVVLRKNKEYKRNECLTMDILGSEALTASGIYAWVVLPALIFIARVTDVTVGTIRLIFVSRGMKILAPIAGFFEVLIWLMVIGQVIRHMTNPMSYIAYAAGFATGNYVGIHLAEKLSLGVVSFRPRRHGPAHLTAFGRPEAASGHCTLSRSGTGCVAFR